MSSVIVRKTLDAAGVTVTEAAKLINVHRVTVHGWIRGVEPRSQMVKNVAERILSLIAKGTELGKLPLKEVPHAERLRLLRKILRELT